jgi:hypothetical protein
MASETPRRLILLVAAVTALAVGFVIVLAAGTSSARAALSSMSAKTGEVSSTNDLYFRLNDMDAQAANALLVGFTPTMAIPASNNAQASESTYEQDRAAASQDLEQIAQNAALAAKDTKLLTAIGGYEGLIAQAVYLDQHAGPQGPAAPPAAALVLYEQASGQMHNDILPIAQNITTSDSSDVNGTYSGDRSGAQRDAILVVVLTVLLAVALIAANQYLSRRFRRVLAPALGLAVVLAVAVGGLGVSTLLHEAQQLKVAKSDAFDSINALTNARAVSYDANADESRWLLDRTPALQQSFFTKASQVASVPGVAANAAAANPSSYYGALNQATDTLALDAGANSVSNVKLGGLLGTELNNITFPHEAEGAVATTKAFDVYIQDDGTIRADAQRGDLQAAVAFDVGTQAGQSNYAFYQYDSALQDIIGINTKAFDAAISNGQSSLTTWSWLPFLAGAAVLALTAGAVYPRLREYR